MLTIHDEYLYNLADTTMNVFVLYLYTILLLHRFLSTTMYTITL